MFEVQGFIILCSILALGYGAFAARSVFHSPAGNERMREIALAIQEGANAYLNRQYKTIGMVGIVITIGLFTVLGQYSAIGFIIGAILSGLAGYIGMGVSVRANVRTAEAARTGLAKALNLAFKAGAVTGLLVVGLALLGITLYFVILQQLDLSERTIT
ncbi:MAG TPA: sodium/proton-translocating pyrophosphatase, partial [Gammaproteobacteria bacterium]|nr:sodium/proton-translocating pyrophosphatase [Gammaproteobacteria bacterium]